MRTRMKCAAQESRATMNRFGSERDFTNDGVRSAESGST